ncbi:MAG: ABC transporter ATP-binding protein, partial [Lachnospiraceae bacterium]|nr:ABC transporter ATP-binding protein [Lachnospiraceae bacterium]
MKGLGSKTKGYARLDNAKHTMRRALGLLKDNKGLFVVVFCFITVFVFANIGSTYLIQPLIAGLFVEGSSPMFLGIVFESKAQFLTVMIIVLAVIYVVGVVANYIVNRVLIGISTKTLYKIRTDLFNHMQTLPIKFFDTNTHGELMSRYTNDVDALNEFIARSIPQIVQSSLQVIGVFAMMISLSWQLTLCVVGMLVCMFLVTKFFGGKAKKNFSAQQAAIGKVNGYVEEMVEGQRVVKVFNHETETVEGFNEIDGGLRKAATRANTYANMMMPIMGNLTHLFYIVIAIVGTIISTTLMGDALANMLGVLASFLILLRQISNPISQLAQQVNTIFMALAGAERIFEIMDTPSETDDG